MVTRRTGFTLVEMMITVAIMGIAAAIMLPALANNDDAYVNAGVSLITGDLDFAQTMSITDPSDLAVVKFDPSHARWWVAPSSTPDTPYTKLYSNDPIDTTMGVGRAYIAEGVTFSLVNVTDNMITYNAFGQLEQLTDPQIIVNFGTNSGTITINAETGFLSVD